MKKPFSCLVVSLLLTGCGGAPRTTPAPKVALEPARDVALESLLTKSRAELATQAVELEKQIQKQDQLRLAGHLPFTFLPKVRLPLAAPIWRVAEYSSQRGFSVPPYLAADAHDTPLALHLARHGDIDAATRLAEPADRDAVHKLKLDRNYPLEWTRLVGLLLQRAQFLLATDNLEGAKELLALHEQLRSILPDATQRSPLGRALLPRGLETLQHAAQAWRKQGRAQFAEQIETFLTKCGVAPAWQWSLPTDRAGVNRQLGLAGAGRGVNAPTPLRALDLLALPVPHDHLDACWVFFDERDQTEAVLLAYRKTQVDYEQASQWVPRLETLQQGKPAVAATLTPGNPYVGGIIEVRFEGAKPAPLARDFGPISLDRTFEHNRRLVAWKQRGASIVVKDAKTLQALSQPLPAVPLDAALDRDSEHDLLVEVRFAYAPDAKFTLPSLAAPLWGRYGRAQVQAGKNVSLTWGDGPTRFTLTLPNDNTQPIVVAATDSSGIAVAPRLQMAKARDLADRQTRLANNQSLARLPRGLETLTLGMKRSDVERLLPGGASALRRDIAGGLMAAYPGQPKSAAEAVLRAIVARFDGAGQLTELRVRYADHPNNKPGTLRKKLDALVAAHGAGETTPLDPMLSKDLPARKGAAELSHVWHDDLTLLTCSVAAGSLEISLRNCPPAHANGEPLAALTYLPRGPDDVAVGTPRSALLAQGASSFEGALLLKTKAGSPFDSVLVWCENDKAARIVARYHQSAAPDPAKHLQETWGRDLRTLGWPWRQDLADRVPQSWTTHDEATRYRLFWQEDNQGTHLLAEWRELK